jgi:hypothetical protein
MCWVPLGAGRATFWHGADALDEVEEVVLDEEEPAAVLLADVELELLPHPAITRTRAMIGSALRTGAR